MKKFLIAYFSFSKKEYNGILILFLLLFALILFPFMHQLFQRPQVYDFVQFEQEIKAFQESVKKEHNYYPNKHKTVTIKHLKPIYFEFDPNKLPAAQWHKLGLSDRQIQIIYNYEAKGGKFYRKEDFKKIYSIKPAQYAQLEPYISIKSTNINLSSKNVKDEPPVNLKKQSILVDLNSTDSLELQIVRGIGPTFATRIIKYRDRLGGFHTKEQLLEVYSLDSVKYEQIKNQLKIVSPFQKININTITFDELKKHPYLSYKQTNAIIQYRKQHGNYKSIEDLNKVTILNNNILRKIAPYLIF